MPPKSKRRDDDTQTETKKKPKKATKKEGSKASKHADTKSKPASRKKKPIESLPADERSAFETALQQEIKQLGINRIMLSPEEITTLICDKRAETRFSNGNTLLGKAVAPWSHKEDTLGFCIVIGAKEKKDPQGSTLKRWMANPHSLNSTLYKAVASLYKKAKQDPLATPDDNTVDALAKAAGVVVRVKHEGVKAPGLHIKHSSPADPKKFYEDEVVYVTNVQGTYALLLNQNCKRLHGEYVRGRDREAEKQAEVSSATQRDETVANIIANIKKAQKEHKERTTKILTAAFLQERYDGPGPFRGRTNSDFFIESTVEFAKYVHDTISKRDSKLAAALVKELELDSVWKQK